MSEFKHTEDQLSPDEFEDRLILVERELAIIKAMQGKIALPISTIVLLWTVLLTAMSAVIFVVRLDTRVTELAVNIRDNQAMLLHHIEQPWHAAAGEKYKAIDNQVQRLEDKVDKIRH